MPAMSINDNITHLKHVDPSSLASGNLQINQTTQIKLQSQNPIIMASSTVVGNATMQLNINDPGSESVRALNVQQTNVLSTRHKEDETKMDTT